MKLNELLNPWIDDVSELEITGISNDSRSVKAGDLFIAYPGHASDGRQFISQAVKSGAAAVLFDPHGWKISEPAASTVYIPLANLAAKQAELAARFYQNPSDSLYVTGVTGTNGKTTIAYQLAQAHELLSAKSAYIGTLGYGKADDLQSLANTTPDAFCLQQLFSRFRQSDISQVCMEVSSHALDQGRTDCIRFSQGIFTNLTHDHLDYHHTMDEYAKAKAKLFAFPELKWAIVNQDDQYTRQILKSVSANCQLLSYGVHQQADVRAIEHEISLTGTRIKLISPWGSHELQIRALGYFNIYNALAIFTSLMAAGYPVSEVVETMSKLRAAPGRMEIVSHEPYTIVDYAHTPDALKNVLETLNGVKKGKIIAVFGCGGDRDKTKRPIMGQIASDNADIVIMTSDNPRTEDPVQILDEIEQGIHKRDNLYKIANREEAIAKAVSLASADDIVLVAGKGHESYQQVGSIRHHFSDQEVLKRYVDKKLL
ncbi:UDP-N-acetylmuramoylalanyl-D-glutamate-2, 6-diaminopimelate ligase [Legionella quinlivanii]|uniref:UDP-N-acetylmuramoyl-L-alanyl-D-glutamate--2,6-diaminopimelate ligase n=1 Tax=Legionella quinlivanii TaxID=45073 RepID=A0A0W0XWC4_9GAMM|nr:UDP-N-acetylmuramoyl-L-alanyl-D-glutamate--2,6-diaminopimelate ligase [Legionella quinlivanii]KTD49121.1 UDP-N-acetylmuramoylalanyl-D-glutamate-2, 6-diaminopimelate ligase [Legionella quinlivanii]SEG43526.1 UDP-N-acetylmuramoylalanyl-D-glutamate--2,6-diaminopimelate ligase [Legionella quinlivanii DSM 21216]STY11630.1 UDP-N-acetylmuramoylalanyl-D-glutamate-2, 6-diaminopimelate ligase [Legionella quinlivanii]